MALTFLPLRLWLLGFGIFITSNILGSIFQIASLPVVILAPLGAVSLLWNALFARLILGDLFSKFMVIGTVLIIVGAVLIARFGIVPEPTHSLEDLLALFRRDAFVIYFSLLGLVLVLALAAVSKHIGVVPANDFLTVSSRRPISLNGPLIAISSLMDDMNRLPAVVRAPPLPFHLVVRRLPMQTPRNGLLSCWATPRPSR